MPSESRLIPAAAKPAKRWASAELGLASRLTSRSGMTGHNALTRSTSAATVSGGIKDGVPPPKKIEATARSGTSADWRSRSASNARVQRAASTLSRTWLLKSQYGHFDRQNGQWI